MKFKSVNIDFKKEGLLITYDSRFDSLRIGLDDSISLDYDKEDFNFFLDEVEDLTYGNGYLEDIEFKFKEDNSLTIYNSNAKSFEDFRVDLYFIINELESEGLYLNDKLKEVEKLLRNIDKKQLKKEFYCYFDEIKD